LLHEFIADNRNEIIARCRASISNRPAPRPTDIELEHGVPLFLGQLADALQSALNPNPAIRDSGTMHGKEMLQSGFTVAQVVSDYRRKSR
jgi:hypothetical protein